MRKAVQIYITRAQEGFLLSQVLMSNFRDFSQTTLQGFCDFQILESIFNDGKPAFDSREIHEFEKT